MVECFRYPKPDLRGFSKCDRGATPGFSEEIDGSGALHAAFLKESRIRSRVQCSVQEIRDAPIVFGPGTLPRQAGAGWRGAPVLFLLASGMTQTPSRLNSESRARMQNPICGI
jgi:hypothetical protein